MASSDLTYSDKRLVKIIRSTQVAMLLAAVTYLFEAISSAASIFSPSLVVLVFASLLVEYSIRCIYADRKSFAFSIYLFVITCALFVSIGTRGGLYSTGIIGVPVVIFLSILYGRTRDVLCLITAIVVYMVVLAKTPIGNKDDVVAITYQIPVVVILICIGGYICWAVGDDMRRAFRKLHDETSKLNASQDAIRKLSKTDFLTGLVNVKQAQINYQETLRALSPNQQLYFYFIDLDGFKAINDLFDHRAGDDLLVLIAQRLMSAVEKDVNVCRLSGDEFIVFYAASIDHDVDVCAKRLLDAISQPHTLFGTSAQIMASMGIVATQDNKFSDIRKRAGMAMYKAKRNRSSQYYVFSEALEKQYMEHIYVRQGLQGAIEKDLLGLQYQPKVNLNTKQIIGVEALVRWTKDNPHNLSPDVFMQVIESTELVHDIGFWVIEEACNACKQWHRDGYPLSVAVNVSAQQLKQADFAERVEQILALSQLDAEYLEIELTERFLIERDQTVERQLARLRAAGVSLAIDDFGTGYSNVSYLMDLDVDVLKLDKSLIDRLDSAPSVNSVIKAILNIAKQTGMKVIAEGVETQKDSNAITTLGCDIGQGYYWSEPLDQDAVIPLIRGGLVA